MLAKLQEAQHDATQAAALWAQYLMPLLDITSELGLTGGAAVSKERDISFYSIQHKINIQIDIILLSKSLPRN